jgi:cell division cycle 20-like protein 1 (cofactor of APC complex)
MYKTIFLEKQSEKLFHFGSSTLKSDNIFNMFENNRNIAMSSGKKILENGQIQKKYLNSENRKIAKTPFKVLDAPNLQDDFYLNLLEWSSQNILSVALDSSLYFWNANNNKVLRFVDLSPNSISSINWNDAGTHIAIGTSQGTTEIWDTLKCAKLFEVAGHEERVSSLAWRTNMLATGSRDKTINLRDLRLNQRSIVNKYEGHTQEVCGLKWSFDGNHLASGGNDNKLMVWSSVSNVPINKFTQHCAAVKGLAWSPHTHGVLASGGGSADRTIKFWNTLDGTLLDSIDTGSQVCNLMFSKTTK